MVIIVVIMGIMVEIIDLNNSMCVGEIINFFLHFIKDLVNILVPGLIKKKSMY
jgi:hypothetical protein